MLPWVESLAPEAAHDQRLLLHGLQPAVAEVPAFASIFHVASIFGGPPPGDLACAFAPVC
jgi:hypothetical protein